MDKNNLKTLRLSLTKKDKEYLADWFGLKYNTVGAILRGDRPGDELIIEAGIIVADRKKKKKELVQFINEEL